METSRQIVEGIGIEYRWVGDRAGPTIVFLHEGLGCVELWRDFPDVVAAATGWGALVYSRWGYGGSDPRPLSWPLDFMEREGEVFLPALLRVLGVGERVLWGHSDGASIALVYAGAVDDPLLRGVVSAAGHVFGEDEFGLASIARAVEDFELGDLRDRLARYHDDVDGAFRGWADTWLHPEFRRWSIEKYLPDVTVPVLVAQGSADEYGTLEHVEAICAGIRAAAHRLVINGASHALHVDARDRLVAETARFVTEVVGSGGLRSRSGGEEGDVSDGVT